MKNTYQKIKRNIGKYALIGLMATAGLTSCKEYDPKENLASYHILDIDNDGQADLMRIYGQHSIAYYAEGFENHPTVDILSKKMDPELRKAASKRLEERIEAISRGHNPDF